MPIKIELLENGNILRFAVEEPWKPEEITAAKEQSRQFFNQATHTLHVLVDLRKAAINIPLINASQQVIGGDQLPNAGHVAVVGVSRIMQLVVKPILRVTGNANALTFFNTLDEAMDYLRRLIQHK